MFHLDNAIANWRRQMHAAGIETPKIQFLQDGCTGTLGFDTKCFQSERRDASSFQEQSQQDVFSADIGVSERLSRWNIMGNIIWRGGAKPAP